jgi:hypothetical protein
MIISHQRVIIHRHQGALDSLAIPRPASLIVKSLDITGPTLNNDTLRLTWLFSIFFFFTFLYPHNTFLPTPNERDAGAAPHAKPLHVRHIIEMPLFQRDPTATERVDPHVAPRPAAENKHDYYW